MANNELKKLNELEKLQDKARETAVSLLGDLVLHADNSRDHIKLYNSYQILSDLYRGVFSPYNDEDISLYHRVAWEWEIEVISHWLIEDWHRKHGGHLIPRKVD
jgi:hypothetical protein